MMWEWVKNLFSVFAAPSLLAMVQNLKGICTLCLLYSSDNRNKLWWINYLLLSDCATMTPTSCGALPFWGSRITCAPLSESQKSRQALWKSWWLEVMWLMTGTAAHCFPWVVLAHPLAARSHLNSTPCRTYVYQPLSSQSWNGVLWGGHGVEGCVALATYEYPTYMWCMTQWEMVCRLMQLYFPSLCTERQFWFRSMYSDSYLAWFSWPRGGESGYVIPGNVRALTCCSRVEILEKTWSISSWVCPTGKKPNFTCNKS